MKTKMILRIVSLVTALSFLYGQAVYSAPISSALAPKQMAADKKKAAEFVKGAELNKALTGIARTIVKEEKATKKRLTELGSDLVPELPPKMERDRETGEVKIDFQPGIVFEMDIRDEKLSKNIADQFKKSGFKGKIDVDLDGIIACDNFLGEIDYYAIPLTINGESHVIVLRAESNPPDLWSKVENDIAATMPEVIPLGDIKGYKGSLHKLPPAQDVAKITAKWEDILMAEIDKENVAPKEAETLLEWLRSFNTGENRAFAYRLAAAGGIIVFVVAAAGCGGTGGGFAGPVRVPEGGEFVPPPTELPPVGFTAATASDTVSFTSDVVGVWKTGDTETWCIIKRGAIPQELEILGNLGPQKGSAIAVYLPFPTARDIVNLKMLLRGTKLKPGQTMRVKLSNPGGAEITKRGVDLSAIDEKVEKFLNVDFGGSVIPVPLNGQEVLEFMGNGVSGPLHFFVIGAGVAPETAVTATASTPIITVVPLRPLNPGEAIPSYSGTLSMDKSAADVLGVATFTNNIVEISGNFTKPGQYVSAVLNLPVNTTVGPHMQLSLDEAGDPEKIKGGQKVKIKLAAPGGASIVENEVDIWGEKGTKLEPGKPVVADINLGIPVPNPSAIVVTVFADGTDGKGSGLGQFKCKVSNIVHVVPGVPPAEGAMPLVDITGADKDAMSKKVLTPILGGDKGWIKAGERIDDGKRMNVIGEITGSGGFTYVELPFDNKDPNDLTWSALQGTLSNPANMKIYLKLFSGATELESQELKASDIGKDIEKIAKVSFSEFTRNNANKMQLVIAGPSGATFNLNTRTYASIPVSIQPAGPMTLVDITDVDKGEMSKTSLTPVLNSAGGWILAGDRIDNGARLNVKGEITTSGGYAYVEMPFDVNNVNDLTWAAFDGKLSDPVNTKVYIKLLSGTTDLGTQEIKASDIGSAEKIAKAIFSENTKKNANKMQIVITSSVKGATFDLNTRTYANIPADAVIPPAGAMTLADITGTDIGVMSKTSLTPVLNSAGGWILAGDRIDNGARLNVRGEITTSGGYAYVEMPFDVNNVNDLTWAAFDGKLSDPVNTKVYIKLLSGTKVLDLQEIKASDIGSAEKIAKAIFSENTKKNANKMQIVITSSVKGATFDLNTRTYANIPADAVIPPAGVPLFADITDADKGVMSQTPLTPTLNKSGSSWMTLGSIENGNRVSLTGEIANSGEFTYMEMPYVNGNPTWASLEGSIPSGAKVYVKLYKDGQELVVQEFDPSNVAANIEKIAKAGFSDAVRSAANKMQIVITGNAGTFNLKMRSYFKIPADATVPPAGVPLFADITDADKGVMSQTPVTPTLNKSGSSWMTLGRIEDGARMSVTGEIANNGEYAYIEMPYVNGNPTWASLEGSIPSGAKVYVRLYKDGQELVSQEFDPSNVAANIEKIAKAGFSDAVRSAANKMQIVITGNAGTFNLKMRSYNNIPADVVVPPVGAMPLVNIADADKALMSQTPVTPTLHKSGSSWMTLGRIEDGARMSVTGEIANNGEYAYIEMPFTAANPTWASFDGSIPAGAKVYVKLYKGGTELVIQEFDPSDIAAGIEKIAKAAFSDAAKNAADRMQIVITGNAGTFNLKVRSYNNIPADVVVPPVGALPLVDITGADKALMSLIPATPVLNGINAWIKQGAEVDGGKQLNIYGEFTASGGITYVELPFDGSNPNDLAWAGLQGTLSDPANTRIYLKLLSGMTELVSEELKVEDLSDVVERIRKGAFSDFTKSNANKYQLVFTGPASATFNLNLRSYAIVPPPANLALPGVENEDARDDIIAKMGAGYLESVWRGAMGGKRLDAQKIVPDAGVPVDPDLDKKMKELYNAAEKLLNPAEVQKRINVDKLPAGMTLQMFIDKLRDKLTGADPVKLTFLPGSTLGNKLISHAGITFNRVYLPINMVKTLDTGDGVEALMHELYHHVVDDPKHVIIKDNIVLRDKILTVFQTKSPEAADVASLLTKYDDVAGQMAVLKKHAENKTNPAVLYVTLDGNNVPGLDAAIKQRIDAIKKGLCGKDDVKIILVANDDYKWALDLRKKLKSDYPDLVVDYVSQKELEKLMKKGESLEDAAVTYAQDKVGAKMGLKLTALDIGWVNSADPKFQVISKFTKIPEVRVPRPIAADSKIEMSDIVKLINAGQLAVLLHRIAGDVDLSKVSLIDLAKKEGGDIGKEIIAALKTLGIDENKSVLEGLKEIQTTPLTNVLQRKVESVIGERTAAQYA